MTGPLLLFWGEANLLPCPYCIQLWVAQGHRLMSLVYFLHCKLFFLHSVTLNAWSTFFNTLCFLFGHYDTPVHNQNMY